VTHLEARDPVKRRPSMSDVGRAAQVSAQTVSRYFTGGYVSAEAKRKIEIAVRDLGYSRNRLPQIMRATRTDTIGFLAMGPMNYGNGEIFTGLSRAARVAEQSLMIAQIDADPSADHSTEIDRALEHFLSMRVDGIIIGTPYTGLEPLHTRVLESVPVVSLSVGSVEGVLMVYADSYGASRSGVRHLLELGHRQILHVAGPADRNEAAARERGYRDELVSWGCTPLPVCRGGEWDAASGEAAARAVDPASFTAVSAANDELALGFTFELRRRGYTVPEDYSIVGVDDMPDAKYFLPPLTSAHLDIAAVGETGMRLMLERVAGRSVPAVTVLPSRLSIRASTAPPVQRHRRSRPGS
jgi:DNA-binding LacI/PurR family transcriptional regulator